MADERPDFRTLTSGTLLETGSAVVYSPDEWHSPIDGFTQRPERRTRLAPAEWTTFLERFGATVRLTYRGNFVQLDTLAGDATTDADQ